MCIPILLRNCIFYHIKRRFGIYSEEMHYSISGQLTNPEVLSRGAVKGLRLRTIQSVGLALPSRELIEYRVKFHATLIHE